MALVIIDTKLIQKDPNVIRSLVNYFEVIHAVKEEWGHIVYRVQLNDVGDDTRVYPKWFMMNGITPFIMRVERTIR